MDFVWLTLLASTIKSLPQDYYPYFDLCHIILCILSVRKETGREFAWKQPLTAWLSCVFASFAGSIICAPLLGEPILAALKDEWLFGVGSMIFLAIFFCPRDLVYKLVQLKLVTFVICIYNEILRANKIYKGLEEGKSAMPAEGSVFFIPVLIAILKANGSILATPIIQLIRGGDWQPQNLEAAILSQTSKLCFLSAFVFLLVPDLEILYPVFVLLFIAVELSGIDVFKPFEDFSFGLFKKVYNAVEGDHKEKND